MKKLLLTLLPLMLLPIFANAQGVNIGGLYFDRFATNGSDTCRFCGDYTVDPKKSSYTDTIRIPSTVYHLGKTYTVTCIGANAFYNSDVTSVYIPYTINYFENTSFFSGKKITSIVSEVVNPKPDGGSGLFTGLNANCVLVVPIGALSNYSGWSRYIGGGIYENAWIKADDKTMTYGSPRLPTLTYSYATLENFSSDPRLSCQANSLSPVGNYQITFENKKDVVSSGVVTFIDGKLSVTKAPLKVKAKSYTITQGDALPSYEVEYNGFVNNEDANVLSTVPTARCAVTSSNVPGTYDITVSGGSATNYDFSYEKGTLTITSAPGSSEPYAVLSNGNTMLTFCYDGNKTARGGMDIGPFNGALERGWDTYKMNITSAAFDASFANCTTLTSTACWFDHCENLTTITDISNLKTDNVTDMKYMFAGCRSLTNLDVSGFKTKKVTDMSGLFQMCESLTSLDVSGFNTENVTNMVSMFDGCRNLTYLDVSGFNTEKVTNMNCMFTCCVQLAIIDVSGFNTGRVTNFDAMFNDCWSVTILDVSKFDTSNADRIGAMFRHCQNVTRLDLSNFDTSNVFNMDGMFADCWNLTTVYASEKWSTANVNMDTHMFYDCTSIVGGAGTTYNASYTDKTYGHIDGGPADPGYLTYKAASGMNDTKLQGKKDGSWYTLDGRQLQSKPRAKGIYIHNGKKRVID